MMVFLAFLRFQIWQQHQWSYHYSGCELILSLSQSGKVSAPSAPSDLLDLLSLNGFLPWAYHYMQATVYKAFCRAWMFIVMGEPSDASWKSDSSWMGCLMGSSVSKIVYRTCSYSSWTDRELEYYLSFLCRIYSLDAIKRFAMLMIKSNGPVKQVGQ